MRKFEVLGVAILATALSVPASATDRGSILVPVESEAIAVENITADADSIGRAWFVELKSPPTADGTKAGKLASERKAFRNALAAAGLPLSVRAEYSTLFNGLSVVANASQVAKLRQLPSVAAVYPVLKIDREETTDMATAVSMTGADIVQSSLGFTGAGVKVAVMDSGIDYDHPDLGGCFGPGCKVARGWDFVGDAFTGSNTPIPDNDPDDCGGHGTHVAGIIGANGTVVGVAPGVSLGAYRVFGCSGSTTADIMLSAMERILADGNRVMNMSIGSALQWPRYPTAVAADRLSRKGVVVVASIGNSGDPATSSYRGLFSAGAPGVGAGVIGTASVENSMAAFNAMDVTQNAVTTRYAYGTTTNLPPTSGTFPLARTGTTSTTNDACAALTPGSLTGQVALIRRGTCGFYNKAYNAQAAGAAAVILYNNTTGTINPSIAGSPAVTIPVVSATAAVGAAIDAAIQAGGATLTWTDQFTTVPNSASGRISTFSSYGPANDMSFKPNLAAPGGNIFSTYPLEQGGYANLSGTSMASPHAAGAAALILEAKPRFKQKEILARLQNTADSVPDSYGIGYPAEINKQGAGLIDIDDAILSKVQVRPAQIALSEFETAAVTKTIPIQITNEGPADTFTISYNYALENYGSNFAVGGPGLSVGCMDVSFDGGSTFGPLVVNVPAGGRRTVMATFVPYGSPGACFSVPPAAPYNLITGGFVTISGASGTQRTVPYMGYLGDMQRDPMTLALIWTNGGSSSNTVFDLTTTVPTFVLQLFEPSPRLVVQVRPVGTLAWRNAMVFPWISRVTASNSAYFLNWDGLVLTGRGGFVPVPDGNYEVQACATRRLNNPKANPMSGTKQCIAMPTITIDRP